MFTGIDGEASKYSIIGAAALLSGSTRMTYSVAVVILETTQNINLFLPIVFTMFAAYGAGSVVNKSIYDGILRTKNIPILKKVPPKKTRNVLAATLMSKNVRSLNQVTTVKDI